MTVSIKDDIFDGSEPCGRPAKFMAPKDQMHKEPWPVCGIHRKQVDRICELMEVPKCIPI
jgi:hypothetical protein